ncbi:hypothetical protein MLD38_004154 [Melastoma candidum]|uniref:Uncharacterized protein n=1 Tax=Melastoma candidum TaxID=119954 RepID=A0ACB9S4U5_9MYRT|nr:hypothetical protein MLD38_004154 [Melastoma candidum]
MEIKHFSHEHPLDLRALSANEINKIRCNMCKEPILDLMYCCEKCKNYRIHRSCSKLPQRITQHPFHPSHPLPIQMRGHYACCGCGQWHDKVHYWCIACNFTISPECALKPTKKYEFQGQEQIMYFLHGHPLTLVDGKQGGDDREEEVCLACEKVFLGPSYFCPQCPSFKLHKSCVEQLPRAIRHFSHPEHPMILRAKDQWFDQPCIACQRSDNILSYRCSMCKIEMDPQCALKPTKHLI